MLRPYQQKAIDMLYAWLEANTGHPCLVLPTGAGKSHIVAALCKDVIQSWSETRVLMLTHSKELIAQNAEKMREHWKNAPLGIYSASLRKKNLGEAITFAGIQSIRKKSKQIGHIDLCIIDECHLISHKDEGGYRTLINELLEINPRMRVVGLTATPYRLGHGLITDKPAIFDALIEPVSIEELITLGHLAPLRSKLTKYQLSTDGVHKRGGEFIESELQAAVDTDINNDGTVDEVIRLAGTRKAWLFFCTGIEHAMHVKDALNARGIVAECITGNTPPAQRDSILKSYKAGNIQAITNCDVLTTGFDFPDIDLIAMLRPTMSPSLYVQMAGRGMRVKSHTDHCLVLDFAGVVSEHGPIVNVQPPKKRGGKGEGEAPIKSCDVCFELVHASAKVCPSCGTPFPITEKAPLQLRDDDIMGIHGDEMKVTGWVWGKHIGRDSGKEMIKITYYGVLSDKPVTEYLTVTHDGWAGDRARKLLVTLAKNQYDSDIETVCDRMNMMPHPKVIEYQMNGKFAKILGRIF